MFRVMVVDDMEFMRKQIRRLPLWGDISGFEIVEEAIDGRDALNKLKIKAVDLLITDIKMPVIDGIELLKEVYENSLATCVVFLSEYREFDFAKEAIQYGIFDYIVKPVNFEELKIVLEKAREYIQKKQEEQIRIIKLEDNLTEKINVYYPTNELDSLVQYVIEGNDKAIEIIEIIVEQSAFALHYDKTKTGIVLENVYREMLQRIKEKHVWIEQFLDMKSYIDISFLQCSNIDLMREKMSKKVERIISIINKFILDRNESSIIRKICDYVIKNVEKDISIGEISDNLFLTKNYIGDIFKSKTGTTIGQYITMVKIERSKQLIIKNSLKNYEIAQMLGYNNVEYFSKLFKKITGLTPTEFKNSYDN